MLSLCLKCGEILATAWLVLTTGKRNIHSFIGLYHVHGVENPVDSQANAIC